MIHRQLATISIEHLTSVNMRVKIDLITNLDDYLNYKHTYTGNLASIDDIYMVEMVLYNIQYASNVR